MRSVCTIVYCTMRDARCKEMNVVSGDGTGVPGVALSTPDTIARSSTNPSYKA